MFQNHPYTRIILFLLLALLNTSLLEAQNDKNLLECRMTNISRKKLSFTGVLWDENHTLKTKYHIEYPEGEDSNKTSVNFYIRGKPFYVDSILLKSGNHPDKEFGRAYLDEAHEVMLKGKAYLCLGFGSSESSMSSNYYVVLLNFNDTNNLRMYAFPNILKGTFNRMNNAGLMECFDDFNNDGQLDFWSWYPDSLSSPTSTLHVYSANDDGILQLKDYHLEIINDSGRNYIDMNKSHWFFKPQKLKDEKPLYSTIKTNANIFDSLFLIKDSTNAFLDTGFVYPVGARVYFISKESYPQVYHEEEINYCSCVLENNSLQIHIAGNGAGMSNDINIKLYKSHFNISLHNAYPLLGGGSTYDAVSQNLTLQKYPLALGDSLKGTFSFIGKGTADDIVMLNNLVRNRNSDERGKSDIRTVKGSFKCIVKRKENEGH